MATKDEILDAISNMTVLELSELLKDFEEKFGVTASAPVAVAGPGAGPGGSARIALLDPTASIDPTAALGPGVVVGRGGA